MKNIRSGAKCLYVFIAAFIQKCNKKTLQIYSKNASKSKDEIVKYNFYNFVMLVNIKTINLREHNCLLWYSAYFYHTFLNLEMFLKMLNKIRLSLKTSHFKGPIIEKYLWPIKITKLCIITPRLNLILSMWNCSVWQASKLVALCWQTD